MLTPLLAGSDELNVTMDVALALGIVWVAVVSQNEPHRFVTSSGSAGVTVGADKAHTSHTAIVVVPAAVTRYVPWPSRMSTRVDSLAKTGNPDAAVASDDDTTHRVVAPMLRMLRPCTHEDEPEGDAMSCANLIGSVVNPVGLRALLDVADANCTGVDVIDAW
jgi:hypothetical protein